MAAEVPTGGTGLLAGVRVVEVAILAPSALAGHLAELGAEVVKVESGAGDYVRSVGRAPHDPPSAMHRLWNRGKRSVLLDLDDESGRENFRRLVARADVVIEGRRPGYLARHGLGYEQLLDVNPCLVFTCLSGYGDSGPYRTAPSHGPAFDAYAGTMPPQTDEQGRPRIPRPATLPAGVATAPLHAAFATVSAVLRSRAAGLPCYLDVAQADAAVYGRALDVLRWRAGDEAEDPTAGDLFAESVLVQYYRTSDGRHVLFQAMEPKFLHRFADLVGRPDLAEGFPADRATDWMIGRSDLRAELAAVFATRSADDWVRICREADIPVSPVNVEAELLDDEHFRHRTQWLPDENGRPVVPALPVRVDDRPGALRGAPALGEHTDEVLAELHEETASTPAGPPTPVSPGAGAASW